MLQKFQQFSGFQTRRVVVSKAVAEDGRREIANLSMAIRAVQRDEETTNARLDDVRKKVTTLRDRLEVALPHVLKALEDVLQRVGVDANEVGEAAPVVSALRSLLADGDWAAKVPHPFVSQGSLQNTLETLQQDVQAWLEALRRDIVSALSGKADYGALRHLSEQMARHEAQAMPLMRTMASFAVEEPKANDAGLVRFPLGPGRCVSCDSKVDVKAEPVGSPILQR